MRATDPLSIILLTTISVLIPSTSAYPNIDDRLKAFENQSLELEAWKAPDEFKRDFPMYLLGFDYEHRRVYYIGYGKFKTRKYVEERFADLKNVRKYMDQWTYGVIHDGEKYAHPDDNHIDEVVVIYDWDEMNLQDIASIPTLKFTMDGFEAFRKLDDFFAYGYFVNVNTLVETTLHLFKPLLGDIYEKIEVYGTKKSLWAPQLLRKIPSDQLPEFLGGSKDYKPIESD